MKIRFRMILVTVLLMSGLSCLGGCATQKEVTGHWRSHDIAANGKDDEWQNDIPQYYDDKQHLTIRILNDAKRISLALSTSAPELQRQFQISGLTVWFDPHGGKEKIFGLHLPANDVGRPGPPVRGDAGPPGGHRDRPNKENRPTTAPIIIEPIKTLSITYSDTTGPLEMTLEEIRRTGIDIGIDRTGDNRLVYEFDIKFSAAPSLESLKPGMVLGIGFIGAAPGRPGAMGTMGGPPGRQAVQTPFGTDMGLPSGRSKGPGGNKSPPGAKGKSLEVWLKVQLADRAE